MRTTRTQALLLATVVALVGSACKSSNPSVPRRAMSEASKAEVETASPSGADVDSDLSAAVAVQAEVNEPVVARVGDREVFVSELLSAWMLTDSVGLRDMLENLVTTRLVTAEAERLGITISDEELGAQFAIAIAELESGLQRNQPGVSLDEWIAGGLGLDPTRYRLGVREDVRRRLLAERVVREFIYTQDWAEVRVLVAETREEADGALARIEAGEPFARVAGELSIDPSGKGGGRIPPVVRNESALSRLAYSTTAGEVGGPILEADRWLLLLPEEFHTALSGSWDEVSGAIEASLSQSPVTEPEYWLWKVEMSERTPADFAPFFDLIGEPAGPSRP
jgi:hypothetical protein